jgi:hypothetical protein
VHPNLVSSTSGYSLPEVLFKAHTQAALKEILSGALALIQTIV